MESRSILDDQITASLYTNIDHAPFRARLYNQESAGAWTTGAGQHWLQIDLRNDSIRITRVATQGRYSYDQWVTRYQLQYGHDGANFQYYREQGQTAIKDFSGNTDRNTVVYQELNPPITARYIRFRPTAWNNFIAMRVELYGCQVISANDEVAAKVPQDCSVNNYNNNYYAGPQKNVENLLTDIKKHASEEKNKCDSNPCLNNGTCNEHANGFNCSCPLGFAGERCQDDFTSTLKQFLSPAVGNNPNWLLCYRATTHGWKADTFHSRCDGKRDTVTIIKKGQYVFGGYTDIPWEHGGKYGATTKAFIFSLRNHEGLGPFKSTARHPGRHAIGRFPGFGPTFGHGHYIYIADNANSNNKSYTNFSYHKDYHVPSAAKDCKTVLAGTYHFTPDEVEVFYVG
ncbi:uncharacterized protein LOC144666576 [Oculina patagonica]